MSRKIIMTLDPKSINAAIREVREYKKWVVEKTKLLNEKLALLGAQEATHRFSTAMYDGENDVVVVATATDNGWTITASGEAVAFLEFGSGVYHNPVEPYPNPRPSGVSNIGEFGKGYGRRRGWVFVSDSGAKTFTRGNPAALGMYYATEEIRNNIVKIAREVFGE